MHAKISVQVTFIIPALNSESTIRECLESIFSQTIGVDCFEVLLIDNGSTDNTVSIAKAKGATVLEGPGLTVAGLRNLGVRNSRGNIIAFVDSDCAISTEWLRNAIPLFDDPHIGAAGADTTVPENGTWVQKTWWIHRGNRGSREFVEWLPTENLLVRRDVLMEIGGFNENLETCEDVDLCYRIGESHKIICDPSISSVHMGEAKTIRHFYKKERWRGRGSFKGFFHHRFNLDEVPSILLPFYGMLSVLILFIGLIIYIMYSNSSLFMASIFFIVVPPLTMSTYKIIKIKSLKHLVPLTILYSVYILARTVSAFSSS